VHGHCTCMARLREVCSHVGAILFYAEANQHIKFFSELLGRWYIRAMVLPTIDDSQSLDYDYCYCEEKGGTMVLCSNPGYKYGQWFHLSCLKLKCEPPWF